MHQRQTRHLGIKTEMQNGNYSSAALLLENLLSEEGSHVGVLSDLAACYYMTAEILKMNQTVEKLLLEYNAAKDFLSSESHSRTLLMLGKMQEERGRLADALEFYSLCANLSDAPDNIRLKARASRLRLHSILNLNDSSGDYLECSTAFAKGTDLQAELEHSLILAEAQMFGAEQAFERWKLAQEHKHHCLDENIFFYDLIEIVGYQQGFQSTLMKKLIRQAPAPIDAFEKTLHRWSEDVPSYSFKDYYDLGKQLTLFSHLRLLAVALKNQFQDSHVTVNHLRISLNALGEKNRQIMNQRCQELLIFKEAAIWNSLQSQVEFQGHFLKIGSTALEGKILSIIKGQEKVSVEAVLLHLYGEEFSETNWSRLRVAIHRLDKKLAPFLGVTKALKITKSEVLVTTLIK